MSKRKDHSVCVVSFEDRRGHLHRKTLRVPTKVSLTHANIVRMTEQATGMRVSLVVGETCTTARRSKSHALARQRR